MDANVVVLNQGYDQAFQAREQQLIDQLSAYDDLVISFSGRLESCYCIDLCRASGVRIRAMIMDTPTRSRSEVSRAIRYCRRYGIDHWIVKTDEMIFCDQLSQLDEIIDPVRRLCEHRATHPEWATLPFLLPGTAEERTGYIEMFGSIPEDTIWLMADHGFTKRDVRYGFNKRQLDGLGKGGNGCLSHRFAHPSQLQPHHLRMVDQAEQMLADMGFDEAQVFFHILCDGRELTCNSGPTLARVRLPEHQRARAFDMQPDILQALKGTLFDLVTLDMVPHERHELAI